MPRQAVLTEEQWAKIAPLLPERSSKGRPWRDNRAVFEGIVWVLRSGARWKDLPSEFPSPATCWRRLRLWEEDGTWLKAWRTLISSLDQQGRIDWEECFMDASFSPAKKGGPQSERPSAERVRSGWWWEAARVFLWESSSPRPRRRK